MEEPGGRRIVALRSETVTVEAAFSRFACRTHPRLDDTSELLNFDLVQNQLAALEKPTWRPDLLHGFDVVLMTSSVLGNQTCTKVFVT